MTKKKQPASKRPRKEPKLSRTHAPPELAPHDWQRALRRQFGRDQAFLPGEHHRRALLLGVPRSQPPVEAQLPRRDSRHGTRRELLFLPRFRHQRTRHLQTHRIHPRPPEDETGRQGRLRPWLATALLRDLPAQRRRARRVFPRRVGLPTGGAQGGASWSSTPSAAGFPKTISASWSVFSAPWRRAATNCALTTMPSISLPGGAMPCVGPIPSKRRFPAAPTIRGWPSSSKCRFIPIRPKAPCLPCGPGAP